MGMVKSLPFDGIPKTHETIAPGDTATGISAAVKTYNGKRAIAALITNESNDANYCIDGSTPTAAAGTNVGHQLFGGASIVLYGYDAISQFKSIDRVSGSLSKQKITCYFNPQSLV